MRRPWALLVLLACGCHPKRPTELATALVEQARRGEIAPEMIDASLVERIRRVLLLKRVQPGLVSTETLLQLWKSSEPGGSSPADLARERRETAGKSIRGSLRGRCQVVEDRDQLTQRLALISAVVAGAPEEANLESQRLGQLLRDAILVRVTCDRGAMGVLAVRTDGWRAADLYSIEEAGEVSVERTTAPGRRP
jgi:hypothetical protein